MSTSAHKQTTHADRSGALRSRPHVCYDKFCTPARLSLNQIAWYNVQKRPAGRRINFKLQTALNPPKRVQSQADGKSMRCYLYFSPRTSRMEQETTVSLSSERTERKRKRESENMNLLTVGERETRCALTHLSGLSVFRERERERDARGGSQWWTNPKGFSS